MKFSLALAALVAPLLAAASTTVDFNPRDVTIHPIGQHKHLPHTNAERMRRGLPLKAPRSTRTLSARNAQTSSTPGTAYSGRIKCSDKSGNFIGYIGDGVNKYGEWGITTDASKAQRISFNKRSDDEPFNLVAEGGGPDATLPLFGWVVSPSSPNDDLVNDQFNFAYLCPTSETGPLSLPTTVNNAFKSATGQAAHAESAVWKFDAGSLVITIQWINTNGNSMNPHIMYVPGDNALAITGSTEQFCNSVSKDAKEVVFEYESA